MLRTFMKSLCRKDQRSVSVEIKKIVSKTSRYHRGYGDTTKEEMIPGKKSTPGSDGKKRSFTSFETIKKVYEGYEIEELEKILPPEAVKMKFKKKKLKSPSEEEEEEEAAVKEKMSPPPIEEDGEEDAAVEMKSKKKVMSSSSSLPEEYAAVEMKRKKMMSSPPEEDDAAVEIKKGREKHERSPFNEEAQRTIANQLATAGSQLAIATFKTYGPKVGAAVVKATTELWDFIFG